MFHTTMPLSMYVRNNIGHFGQPADVERGLVPFFSKISGYKAYSYLLLTRLLHWLKEANVQLACVKHIASVHSEQGSNSSLNFANRGFFGLSAVLITALAERFTKECAKSFQTP